MTDQTSAITPGWLDWYRGPTEPTFALPHGGGGRPLPRIRPRRRIPLRGRTQVHARRRLQARPVRPPRPPRHHAQRHRAGHLPRCRQQRPGGRPAYGRRPGPRGGDRAPRRQRTGTAASARRRSARGALQLRTTPGGRRAHRGAGDHRPQDRTAGMARRPLLRGSGPGRPGDVLRLPARAARHRPHGPPRHHTEPGRARVRPLPALRRGQRRLGQGLLPRAPDRHRTARPGRRAPRLP